MAKKETGTDNSVVEMEDPVLGHIADYIVQALIKEDVNAFAEADLLHQLLAYKLADVAPQLMYEQVRAVSELAKSGQGLNLINRVGGITQARRITFRSGDQYNAFVALFFQVMEEYPELVARFTDESVFEDFMIYCIYEFKEKLDEFARAITQERLGLEKDARVYSVRSQKAEAMQDIPTYADFVAEKIDGLVS